MPDRVCVVGLGYVGLPLAVAFDDENHDVIGYDIDPDKVERLRSGEDPTGDVGDGAVASSTVEFTSNPAAIGDADVVIITVPTPVDSLQTPNLEFVRSAGRTVGEHLSPGTTVVLESTVYPGATRDELAPAIEEASGYTAGEEFYMGYSPERTSPGETGRGVRDVKKIVSGQTPEVRDRLAALYDTIVEPGVYPAPDIETAEAAKVIENVQRDLNIALMNELAIVFDRMGLETTDVIEAAATKWNFHEYTPGLVGGHCIPVDPHYLAFKSEREGFSPKLILQAREINEYMPKHTAEMTLKALNQRGNVLQESTVLVLGLAYKPNVGDIRTSEVGEVIKELQEFNVDVVGHDPHVDVAASRDEFDIPIQEEASFDGFDAVMLATPHDEFDDLDLARMHDEMADDPLFVDVMGALDEATVNDHGFAYRRL
ncbi:nucleotide sugar dehydrogenase [Halobacteriaceae archaeon GCM10025711]